MRNVFDASAHIKAKPCLNDIFNPGPCLIPLTFDILLRFGIGKIGLVADMRQAFLQLKNCRETSRLPYFDLA